MAEFEPAYRQVIANEGGYVNDPEDLGGETYKGIARNYYPNWAGWWYIDRYKATNGPIATGAIIDSPPVEASVRGFYRGLWKKYRMGEIDDQALANNFFDFIVLAKRAVATMQEALNRMGFRVVVDNIIGPQTITAINRADPRRLNEIFVQLRKKYHQQRVRAGLVSEKFLRGWIKRAEKFAQGNGLAAGGIVVVLLASLATVWLVRLRSNENER